MGAIRKRGIAWQLDYVDPIGKRIRKTFKKRKEAEAELGKRVSLMAEGRYLDVKKDFKTTLGKLLLKYTENFGNQTCFKNSKELFIRNFKESFGEETLLSNVRYVDVETYRNTLKQKITRKGTIRTDASVNREMSCLHHLFSKGVEWELLEQSPFDRGRTLLLKENNTRLRFLSEEEIQDLLDACPSHLKDIVVCAINTGMRKGEILSLKWEQVRNGLIYLEETKTNESRQIPLNDTMEQLFKEIRKRQHLRSEHVFTYVNTGADMQDPAKNREKLKLVIQFGSVYKKIMPKYARLEIL